MRAALLLLLPGWSGGALPPATWPMTRPLVMWSSECVPFTSKATPEGFTVEVWTYIAKKLRDPYLSTEPRDWNHTYVPLGTLVKSSGEFDVALGCVTITSEREQLFDFSYAYLETGLGVMVRQSEGQTLWSWVGSIVLDFFKLCALLWFLALFFAHLMWLGHGLQKKGETTYLEAIYNGTWFGVVTMTTVGYGDLTPRNTLGRILTMLFMMAALLIFGYFTALLSAKFTEDRIASTEIESLEDLDGKRIIVYKGSFGEHAARAMGSTVIPLLEKDDMVRRLVDGQGDAIVNDWPVLKTLVQQWKDSNLVVLPHVFNNFGLGLMFPEGSKLREHVNMALLAWREDGAAGAGGEDQLHDKYFPRPRSPEADNALDKYDAIYAVSGAVVFVFLVAFVVRFGMGKCKPQRPPPPPLEGLPALLAANTTASSTLLQRMICSEAALGPKELKRLGSDCISAAAALQAGLQGSREEAPADAAGAKPPPQLPPPQPEPQGSYARLQEQPPPDQQQPQPQRSQQPWPAQESQQAQRPPPQPIAVHSPPPPTTAVQGPYGAYSMPAATVDGAPLSPLVVQSYGRGRMRVQPALTPQLHSRAPPSQPASPMASSYHRVDHI